MSTLKSLPSNNSGKKLTSSCRSINILSYLKLAKNQLKEAFFSSHAEIDDHNVDLISTKTGRNGARFWFKCPICGRKAGIIYKHPQNSQIGCRKCLNLEYRSRRYKGMIEARDLKKPNKNDTLQRPA